MIHIYLKTWGIPPVFAGMSAPVFRPCRMAATSLSGVSAPGFELKRKTTSHHPGAIGVGMVCFDSDSFRLSRIRNNTGKQCKCYNTLPKTPGSRCKRNRAFYACWGVPSPLNTPLAWPRDFCEIALRTAYRCSASFSRWVFFASGSLPKMRSMLALAVNSSRISSFACR